MSLLDSGTDTVLVLPEVADVDADGNPVRRPGDTPVPISCRIQPVSAAEASTQGQGVVTVYRITARTWPPGAFSTLTWAGRTWDVLGEPQRHAGSPATAHTTVLIKAREPEVI